MSQSIQFAGFVGPSYTAASRYFDCQRTINWFLETSPVEGSASAKALLPTPGLLAIAGPNAGGQPIRGMYVPPSKPDRLYFVAGSVLKQAVMANGSVLGPRTAPAAFTITTVGSLATSTGPVCFSDNGTTLALVDGPSGYFVTFVGNVFVQINDPGFYGSTRVDFVDGYFVFNRPGTQQFYISGLYATTFDALDFASKEAWPDNIVCCFANHRELWLFGQQSAEVWVSQPTTLADGSEGFAFQRNQGAFMQHGIKAPFSICRVGPTFAWLGTDDTGQVAVWVANGYSPQKISTPAVDVALARYGKTDDAIAFSYRWNGHEFYQITFPAADATWVYDLTEGQWHERLRMDAYGKLHRHQGTCHAAFSGGSLVGDYRTDIIWEQAQGVYECVSSTAAYQEAIPRIRRATHITAGRKRIRFDKMDIRFQPGVEGDRLYTDQPAKLVVNPQAMLRWSNDGGSTWGNEHWTSIGQRGQYGMRAIWRSLGLSYDRVFELRITDPVNAVVVTAQMDFQSLRA